MCVCATCVCVCVCVCVGGGGGKTALLTQIKHRRTPHISLPPAYIPSAWQSSQQSLGPLSPFVTLGSLFDLPRFAAMYKKGCTQTHLAPAAAGRLFGHMCSYTSHTVAAVESVHCQVVHGTLQVGPDFNADASPAQRHCCGALERLYPALHSGVASEHAVWYRPQQHMY